MDYLIEFDYEADEPDELSIRKGDIVNKVKPHEDGWLFGVLRGKEGVFPSNFGKPLKDERKRSQDDEIETAVIDDNRMSTSVDDEETVDSSAKNQKKVVGVGFGNIFSGGQIQLKQTNMKDMRPKQSPSEEVKNEIHIEKKPSMKAKVEMVRAIHSYPAENSDELSLEEGDIITVLDKDNSDEGWWKGKHANGSIGVFPDNFVEPIKNTQDEAPKPLRPVMVGKIAPPVLAAKPNIQIGKNVPQRPPILSEVKNAPSKPSTRLSHLDKDDGISFDEPLNHKPLVGPNAGRAKRPGKKLPTNINVVAVNNPEDEGKRNVTQKKDLFSNETSDIIIPKQKHRDHSNFNESKSPEIVSDHLSKQKSKETFTIEKTPDRAPDKVPDFFTKQKSKDNLPSEKITEKAPEIYTSKPKPKETVADKTSEIIEPKRLHNFKANTLPQKTLIDTTESKLKNDSNTPNDDVHGLQLKISNLEEENTDLRNEVRDLRKSAMSTADQVSHLTNKLNKLIKEFDEEKTKRVANEVNITRLKDTIEDLETTMLSRSSK